MKKILRRIICLGLTLIACVGGLCACNEDDVGKEYGATLINDVDKFMREDFLEENRTSGVFYEVPTYDEETDTWKEEMVQEKEGPKTREFIITNEEEYLRLFKDTSSIAVNFETQMLVVHMFTKADVSPVKLTWIKVDHTKLFVTFKYNPRSPDILDSCMPGQGGIAVIMNKYDIDSTKFVYER